MRAHAALPDEERTRRLNVAAMVMRASKRQYAELMLAEAGVIVMRHFGDQVGKLLVHTAPCRFGDQALISEVVAADGAVLWAALRRGHPLGAPWKGEAEAQEHITRAWALYPGSFRPVDKQMGLHEIRLHCAKAAQ